MESEVRAASHAEMQPDDIIFECPQCGKSLAIDVRGAGLIVRCPDCKNEIQVPGIPAAPGSSGTQDVSPLPVAEDHPPFSIDTATPEELRAEIRRLRHQLAAEAERHQRISAELGLIQAALDRLVGLIEETPSGNAV